MPRRLDPDKLREENRALRAENRKLRAASARLRKRLDTLSERIRVLQKRHLALLQSSEDTGDRLRWLRARLTAIERELE